MRAPAPLLACLLLTAGLAAASHEPGDPRSLGGATLPQQEPTLKHVEAEAFDDKPTGAAIDDPAATDGKAWRMPTYGNISFNLRLPQDGIVWLLVRARGEHPPGMLTTHMHPVVDGEQRGEWDVGPSWATYRQSLPMTAGAHVVTVENFNNYHAPAADRTLFVDWVEVSVPFLEGAPYVGANRSMLLDGPQVQEAGTGMARLADPDAVNQTSWQMWGIGCFVEMVVADDAGRYHWTARLRGDEPGGVGSHTTLWLDGRTLLAADIGAAWESVDVDADLAQGPRILKICYDNDYGGDQKRNLWLDETSLKPVAVTPSPTPTLTPPATTPVTSPPSATPPATTPVATPPTPGPTAIASPPPVTPSGPPAVNESSAGASRIGLASWAAILGLVAAALAWRRR